MNTQYPIISNIRKSLAAHGINLSFTDVASIVRSAGIIDDENRISEAVISSAMEAGFFDNSIRRNEMTTSTAPADKFRRES